MTVIPDERNNGMVSKDLLIHSDIIVGYNSTMLLEASLLRKPVMHVVLGKCRGISGPSYCDVYKMAYTTEEISKHLEDYVSGKQNFISEKADKLVEEYLGNVDGKCYERMSNAILKEMGS